MGSTQVPPSSPQQKNHHQDKRGGVYTPWAMCQKTVVGALITLPSREPQLGSSGVIMSRDVDHVCLRYRCSEGVFGEVERMVRSGSAFAILP